MIKVAVYGNCHAEEIAKFLQNALRDDPSETRWIVSYEPRTDADIRFLKEANIIIEQITGGKYTALDPELKRNVPVVRFPFLSGSFLWPFEQLHPRNVPVAPHFPAGPFPADFGNMFINKMLNDGMEPEAVIDRWFCTDLTKLVNLDRHFEIHKMLMKKIGADCDFCLWDEFEATFARERYFWNAKHPTRTFFERLIYGVLSAMKLELPAEDLARALQMGRYDMYSAQHPVHPQIVKHFGLQWCNDATTYRYMDEDFYTYNEFIPRYVKLEYDNDIALGGCLTRMRTDLPRAEAMLKSGIERHPRSPYAHQELSVNLQAQNRLQEALAYAERSIALCDYVPRFYEQKCMLEQRMGLMDRAKQTAAQFHARLSNPPRGVL